MPEVLGTLYQGTEQAFSMENNVYVLMSNGSTSGIQVIYGETKYFGLTAINMHTEPALLTLFEANFDGPPKITIPIPANTSGAGIQINLGGNYVKFSEAMLARLMTENGDPIPVGKCFVNIYWS